MSVLSFAPALDNTYFDGQTNMYWMRGAQMDLRIHPIVSPGPQDLRRTGRERGYRSFLSGTRRDDERRSPVYKLTDKSPGPDLTASAAGTMALCSMIFTDIDSSLASRCLQASKTLYP
jgi:hypothetical protein